MKKISLVALGIAIALTVCLDANAFELKLPDNSKKMSSVSQENSKKAKIENYKKDYQVKIKEQQTKLNAVKDYDKNARLALANIILTKEKVNEIKALPEEEFDKALNTSLIETLSAETFIQDYADYDNAKKEAYEKAVKNIQIADNRYKNVSNELTAPLKTIVDGDISVISSREELKNAGSMILGIKKNLGTNSSLKKAIRKVNKANNITIVVPDSERVIYPKEGTIGSINYNLDQINYTVTNANKTLGGILYTKEQQKALEAIKNNKDLSDEERTTELKAKAKEYFEANQTDGTIKKAYESLSAADKEKFNKAASDVIGAVALYGALGYQCTKLGFNISRNPLLAAPLTFELGALKDTAGLIKDSSSNLTKSVVQLKKVMKDNGISVTNTASAKTTGISGSNKFKLINFKK